MMPLPQKFCFNDAHVQPEHPCCIMGTNTVACQSLRQRLPRGRQTCSGRCYSHVGLAWPGWASRFMTARKETARAGCFPGQGSPPSCESQAKRPGWPRLSAQTATVLCCLLSVYFWENQILYELCCSGKYVFKLEFKCEICLILALLKYNAADLLTLFKFFFLIGG